VGTTVTSSGSCGQTTAGTVTGSIYVSGSITVCCP
jgi:hypothetical protein